MQGWTRRIFHGAALLALAVPVAADNNPLTMYRSATLEGGGIAAGATCIWDNAGGNQTDGTIALSSIPPGATVESAYLYYIVLNDAAGVPAGAPTLNGTPITPVMLGEVPRTPCFDATPFTATFRADVTSLVTGNGSYALARFPFSPAITEGATLVVLYCSPGGQTATIVMFDGIDVIDNTVTNHLQTLSGFAASSTSVRAQWLALIGNGQGTPGDGDRDALSFDRTDMEQLFGSPAVLSGGACRTPRTPDGGYWDLGLYDVSALVAPGTQGLRVMLDWTSDCYSIAAHILAVSSDDTPAPCQAPPPCVQAPARINDLLGVKVQPGDVRFSWDTEPTATGGYRLYTVATKREVDPVTWPSATKTQQCTAAVGILTCTDAGALPPPPGLLFYQVVAVCSDGLTEGGV